MSKHYLGRTGRLLLAASTISGITLLSALAADANTLPSAGTEIQNQATAEFTDEATNTSSSIVSDTVKVTVAEVAGITGLNNGVSGPVYRTKVVNFDFKITNAGNDPTKFFIPGKVSKAIYENASGTGQTLPNGSIGNLSLIAYKADSQAGTQEIAIADSQANSNKIPAAGASTGSIAALVNSTNAAILNNGGSIKPGGYVIIRVPVTIPYDAKNGTDNVEITLGNTATGSLPDNQAYAANGANGTGNDLYTVDNSGTDNGDTANAPANGEKETSMVQKASVVEPTTVTISGTLYDDRDNSGANNGTIFTTGEFGTDGKFGTETTQVRAVLVNATTGKVIASQIVKDGTNGTTKGAYEFTQVPGITDVKVILAKVDGTANTAPPTNELPATWVKTADIFREFRTQLVAIPNQDFGIRQKGKLVLVKRITAINGTPITDEIDNPATPDDNSTMNWPANYLKGKVDGGQVKPGDEIEYTIYFLNNQGAKVTKARICDPIIGQQTYKASSMKLSLSGAAESPLSDTDTDTDKANQFAAGVAVPSGCGMTDATPVTKNPGGVLVDLAVTADTNTHIPGVKYDTNGSTLVKAGTYGYFRFKTTVNGTTPDAVSGGGSGNVVN